VADATCAGCGCLCDDIAATLDDGLSVARTCALGDAWFADRATGPVALVGGREASLDEAADAAAAILRDARAPLVYGLGGTGVEAQRQAVGLAEAIGAIVDGGGGSGAGLAFQAIGSSTATFGEVRDRPQVVVAWRADPATTNPRLLERLRLERDVRGERAFVVVDSERTATAAEADAFVQVHAGRGFEALWALRALAGDAPLDRRRARDLPVDALDELAERLHDSRHAAFLHGPLEELEELALFSLVRDLSRERHAVTLSVRGDGNARGAEDVLTWQTGFPSAVSFARGFPRGNPGELSAAAVLERGEVDAALVIASDPIDRLPGLRELPTVVVDTRTTETAKAARVAFAAAADGIEVAGTAHRMDGVPVPLRALLAGDRPSVEDVLLAIAGRL
jgi:formylmethanofuran dehydrogenase subunit B